PLPPLEIQQEIVDELEGYQKIIDGCKQVVENYKPTIDIDPSWEMVELGEIGEIISGGTPKSDEKSYWNGEIKWLTLVDLPADESISYITNSKRKITELGLSKSSAKMIPIRSVIVSSRATIGRVGINEVEVSTNQGFKSIVIDETKHLTEYIAAQIFLKRKYMQEIATGGTFGEINKTNFMKIKIPIPSLDIQKEIVQKIEEEKKVIEGNKKLIEIYTQKIKDRINKVWGED
ncbi:restriction endonuclease subunit S, partial [Gammaproteobacteria bacterium]|nr:restriction endonuclease subunit S [Gammaproteobacteria bacterium]